jgi:hypothetical protein
VSTEMIGPNCSVTVLGRAGLRYREGSATVLIDGEMLVGNVDFVVYAASIQRWENSGEAIPAERKRQIIDNILVTFRQNGLVAEVEG